MRAAPACFGHGHGRAHAKGAGLVGGGGDDTAMVMPDDDGQPFEGGIVVLFDGGKERVHVEVEDHFKESLVVY